MGITLIGVSLSGSKKGLSLFSRDSTRQLPDCKYFLSLRKVCSGTKNAWIWIFADSPTAGSEVALGLPLDSEINKQHRYPNADGERFTCRLGILYSRCTIPPVRITACAKIYALLIITVIIPVHSSLKNCFSSLQRIYKPTSLPFLCVSLVWNKVVSQNSSPFSHKNLLCSCVAWEIIPELMKAITIAPFEGDLNRSAFVCRPISDFLRLQGYRKTGYLSCE